jgi:hypothetical protein
MLRWLPKIGLIKWGFEGLCINEFTGLIFTNSDSHHPNTNTQRRSSMIRTGTDALEQYGLLSDRTLYDVAKAQCTIAFVCWILSYIALTMQKQKFVVMNKPR